MVGYATSSASGLFDWCASDNVQHHGVAADNRFIPDHRRAEGRRFELATVLLYAIVAMVGGANSYRQMHEFICIHLERLPEGTAVTILADRGFGDVKLFALRMRGHRPIGAARLPAWPGQPVDRSHPVHGTLGAAGEQVL